MKYRVVELLQDPVDGAALRVTNATTEPAKCAPSLAAVQCTRYCAFRDRPVTPTSISVDDCVACYAREIVDGDLLSATGHRYPIVGGIPRLLSSHTAGWVRKNQDTFSLEWKMFRFGERNWGQDTGYRKELFLRGMRVKPDELRGTVLFDAGCGSGLLSIALAESYGTEVVAMDLAYGIEQAYAHNANPFVYFIQGSVLEPPVRERSVDFVYCAGVLVAIPDPRAGFAALRPALKPGGRCFIWMYHPIDAKHHPHDRRKMLVYNWLRVHVVSRLPIRLQHTVFLGAIPVYLAKREIGTLLRRPKARLTWREKMQNLTDMFSPVYQHRFAEDDIVRWYEELGFVNVQVAYQETYGFAVRGDIPRPHDPDSGRRPESRVRVHGAGSLAAGR